MDSQDLIELWDTSGGQQELLCDPLDQEFLFQRSTQLSQPLGFSSPGGR